MAAGYLRGDHASAHACASYDQLVSDTGPTLSQPVMAIALTAHQHGMVTWHGHPRRMAVKTHTEHCPKSLRKPHRC